MTQFTANEVREAITWKYGDKSTWISAMLRAYADRLEADEKAVPVAWRQRHLAPDGSQIGWILTETRPAYFYTEPLYTNPAPSDAERLAEALRRTCRKMKTFSRTGALDGAVAVWVDEIESVLAAHCAQAQPPAASVPDAMQELADKYHELLWAVARKFPGETRHETALRYIREAELQSCEPKCGAAMAKESGR